MEPVDFIKGGRQMNYRVIEQLSENQIKDLHNLFQLEWWTKGRNFSDVVSMLKMSDLIIGISDSETDTLIGFARVLTDYVYKALIFDVMVSDEHRGKHLGAELMSVIMKHPTLENVQHFELYCRPEMRPFYQKWGFTDELTDLHFMRMNRS